MSKVLVQHIMYLVFHVRSYLFSFKCFAFFCFFFFFSSRRRHTRFDCDWSSDVCSSDLSGDLDGACAGVRGRRAARRLSPARRDPHRPHAWRPDPPAVLRAVHALGERPFRGGLVPRHAGAAVRLARRRHGADSGPVFLSAGGGGIYAEGLFVSGSGALRSPSRPVRPKRFSSASTATCCAVKSSGPNGAPQRTHNTTDTTPSVVGAGAAGAAGA